MNICVTQDNEHKQEIHITDMSYEECMTILKEIEICKEWFERFDRMEKNLMDKLEMIK